MSYKITDIHSIELDRKKPFDMKINLKDKDGHTIESVSVTQDKANATFAMINTKWWKALENEKS